MSSTENPLTPAQRSQIIWETQAFIEKANELYQTRLRVPDIYFDLKGRSAGMFALRGLRCMIRYNPFIFARYYEDNFYHTIAHEVAHYVTYKRFGRHVKPHGPQWRQIMHDFERPPQVYCNYDLTQLPQRSYTQIAYYCHCGEHQLTKIRHNRILKGMQYYCRKCGEILKQRDGQRQSN